LYVGVYSFTRNFFDKVYLSMMSTITFGYF
jgi:hypothetical protein